MVQKLDCDRTLFELCSHIICTVQCCNISLMKLLCNGNHSQYCIQLTKNVVDLYAVCTGNETVTYRYAMKLVCYVLIIAVLIIKVSQVNLPYLLG